MQQPELIACSIQGFSLPTSPPPCSLLTPATTPLRCPLALLLRPSLQEKQQKEREARSGFRVEQTFNLEDFILPWASGERASFRALTRCGQQA